LAVRWFAGILKGFLDHSPWNYNKAIGRAIRNDAFLTHFEAEYAGS
jgi:hypothetical protein